MQNIYNPYLAPQYSHLYGAAGTLSPALYPYMGQPLQAGHGFSAPHGYGVQGPLVQFSGPGASSMTTMPQQYGTVPVLQGPVPSAGIVYCACYLILEFVSDFIQDGTDI